MRSLATFVLTAIAVAVSGCGNDERSTARPDIGSDPAIDAMFAAWNTPGSPGCAVAVARNGVLEFSRGYGYANLDYNLPVTPETIFDVASVTKQFVAASLSMLQLDGKLSLDDDVRKWLPELPQYESTITLRHMIHHTSGLRDYLTLFPLAGRNDYYPISHPQILQMMSRQRGLNFTPGERYEYSNTGYMLLSQVVERASGQTLGAFARQRIFEPLGMQHSQMYEDRSRIIEGRSIGYAESDDGSQRIVHNYNFDVAGDGQLYSTMEDLLKWDEYLHGTNVPPIHSMMLTDGRLNNGDAIGYAQGLVLSEYRGLKTVGHSGSSWGFRTQLVRFVDPALSIAISCNSDNASPWTLATGIADHLLADEMGDMPDEQMDTREEAAAPSAATNDFATVDLEDYVGTYYSTELDATYRIQLQDGGLTLRIEQEPNIELALVSPDDLEMDFHPPGWSGPARVQFSFHRAAGGNIAGFVLGTGSEQGIEFAPTSIEED